MRKEQRWIYGISALARRGGKCPEHQACVDSRPEAAPGETLKEAEEAALGTRHGTGTLCGSRPRHRAGPIHLSHAGSAMHSNFIGLFIWCVFKFIKFVLVLHLYQNTNHTNVAFSFVLV